MENEAETFALPYLKQLGDTAFLLYYLAKKKEDEDTQVMHTLKEWNKKSAERGTTRITPDLAYKLIRVYKEQKKALKK